MRCLKIEGLNIPQKEMNVVGYVGESGQTTISKKDSARTITISGDLIGGKNQLAYANRVLYYEGHLVLMFDQKVRKIKCKCTSFPDPERFGRDFKRIVVQFICDKPEFTDFENTVVRISRRKNNTDLVLNNDQITGFSSPMIYTTRTTEADVYNSGDLDCEPIFYITAQTNGTGISIFNDTTEQHITLNYSISQGETVTIDIDKRKITNNNGDNLINFISNDTFLSDFWLKKGVNHLRVYKDDDNLNMVVTCEYSNKYVEGVY